ncbi:MAG: alpha/beta fold hydrolase [Magnetococcales bacterium]|nr:alpha/beta fold hydrolase [Magnetococcales bacterium]
MLPWIGPCAAQADVAILVHGYFSGDDAWQQAGVTEALEAAGWMGIGRMIATGREVVERAPITRAQGRGYLLADLPSEASLSVQAEGLRGIITTLRARRGTEKSILIGHSAGGVVARLLMVRAPDLAIDTLITIATPHLGTDKAEMAGLLASTPLSMMAPMMGVDTLNRSRTLYAELERERPGNFLYQLNRQPHPKARYISIMRREGFALYGDNTVPAWSQDMARVAALKEHTGDAIQSGADHSLDRRDGKIIARLLEGREDR